ncbi:hypothetical protein A3F08_02105 [Candidatus Berkelbacteria bacterium RIFCSPHIGHO2_12_FULL_36_9]|uniref:histidine kinase n=1 Tax=Candidatus Berkelbacteria bacterium RIFCSPHIGHO2_12_FULL_36_9 TaxID=1797469 RepID=A0A1F5EDL3_9BACT|nr:MAG: hypothetical protein A3F08_02105 [Candidatus Berkelbacteria bacterium RIFCSPHIGHO2_12_FULL_36_9]
MKPVTQIQNANLKPQNGNAKSQNGEITISISDTGIGISPEDQKHLFEKFYRASNAASNGAQGTGLGLYITKNIIELMGGKVWVESTLGKGSTFSFTLKSATPEQIKNLSHAPEGPIYVPYKK